MIRLTGTLRCATPEDAHLVGRLLPDHIRLSRASAGCLSFTVLPQPDGLTWAVDETFSDRAAFQAHQARTARSEWGLKTAHIAREYKIRDRADPNGAAPSTDKSPI
jgi:quinol monooxygenase YgiN